MINEEVRKQVGKYAEKHDLDDGEEAQLEFRLRMDMLIYGNCGIDMREGRIHPADIAERKQRGELSEL